MESRGKENVALRRIRVYGIVQGVGFRPTVARLAEEHGISGTVANCGPYVEIFASGNIKQLEDFTDALKKRPPKRAVIVRVQVKEVSTLLPMKDLDMPDAVLSVLREASDRALNGKPLFRIVESEKTSGEIYIPPDIAICDDCKRELYDRTDRRYLHPFINCTSCGPRLTILESLPYDRERTSMKEFPMCPACGMEYENPESRRFDAQPVCCNSCGPSVYALPIISGKKHEDRGFSDTRLCDTLKEKVYGAKAIRMARQILAEGGIVAVKGIGGFHLACDAASDAAVMRLREKKHRPVKPFAVMMKDISVVSRECVVSSEENEILNGYEKPILLLDKKEENTLSKFVAPGNPSIGVMLPYAPIQLLLFDYHDDLSTPDALVMTSGNVSGAPICKEDSEALERIAPFCDVILSHDRVIRTRADDSVLRLFHGKPSMIRRSRGYAPLPVVFGREDAPPVLAVGGELKNTFCLSKGDLYYLSSYIGDLADPRSVSVLSETIERFEEFLEEKPKTVVCDLHPGYQSVRLAKEIAQKRGAKLIQVQHHYAHILSCMAENNVTGPVLGVAMDGTGYGTDGTIWGGELLLCDLHGFSRKGHIAPFSLVGGDAASREGWRAAVSMLLGAEEQGRMREEIYSDIEKLGLCTRAQAQTIAKMREKRINTVESTSAGRLFDAVSAILGICRESTFEGEAAMALQFKAEAYWEKVSADNILDSEVRIKSQEKLIDNRIILPTDEIVWILAEKKLEGWSVGKLAYWFHSKLVHIIAKAVEQLSISSGIKTVALSGGCFQNLFLTELLREKLTNMGMSVLYHSLVPANDGGIALGQAMYAAANPDLRSE